MNKGFTLIEIIVVLIILGVLSAIAIPSYFAWIERSRAPEALAWLKSVNDQMQMCALTQSQAACLANISTIGQVPFNTPYPKHFDNWGSANGGNAWMIVLHRNSVERGYDPDGTAECSGSGLWSQVGAGQGSAIALCHNYDGRGTNYFVGSGFYQGMF